MGLRNRFLTAVVGVPLALWAILYDALLCLSLVLVLQAICVQELHELLRRTRAGREVATTRAGVGVLDGSLLLHIAADAVALVAAFGGRNASGVAMSVGMTLVVARRLALMRDHWAALRPPPEETGEGSVSGVAGKRNGLDGMPLRDSQNGGRGDGAATATGCGKAVGECPSGVRDRVMESGIFLLGLEASAMAWLVGGWSSLVALRFRGSRGAADIVFLLAVVFNSDNGGLLAGSVFKVLRRNRNSYFRPQRQQPSKRSPPAQAELAATGSKTPGLLAVASPNKTWVGVTGAIVLGTATALVLEGLAGRLLMGRLSRASAGSSDHAEDVFTVTGLGRGLLCAAGVAVCMVGVVGDLWESLLKRAAMVKDSGAIFPGHGGCLDRLDGQWFRAGLWFDS
eukprot:g5694.t1